MNVSVVISTYNRAASLRQSLQGLRHQTYQAFEVIVVNGPSTDATANVLAEFSGMIRVLDCPEANLSKSRNVGIANSNGDIVAFIDDDSIPAPQWLEELLTGYDSDEIGGVGGIVYDHTGYALQQSACVFDRRGDPRGNVLAPMSAYSKPGGDAFVHLLGTNCSFRRRCLEEIGGFDEEFEYYLDETEVCLRLIDGGYRLRLLDGAPVYHKFLASHLRCAERVLRKPYPIIKNRFYFALRAARPRDDVEEILDSCRRFADDHLRVARRQVAQGLLSDAEFAAFTADVERAVVDGTAKGRAGRRRSATIGPVDRRDFRRFPTLRPASRRLNVCFVSQEMPPESCGGIGRFTLDLAHGFAAAGHEVHLLTHSPDHNRVDFERGLWVHRLAAEPVWTDGELSGALMHNLNRAAAVHREVLRIRRRRPVDLVSAPIWDFEGLYCLQDQSLTTILTLHTTFKIVADLHASSSNSPAVAQRLGLERATVHSARYVTAPSHSILESVRRDYGAAAAAAFARVIPHGLFDQSAQHRPRKPDGRVRILFVGRLERRKGVDVLLAATERLIAEFQNVEFVLVGDDSIVNEDGCTNREAFEMRHTTGPVKQRVVFRGLVSEEELYRQYAECDVFCLPARYESFGLVLVEAMMFGKPVVAAAAGGMTEVVADGVNGFVVQVGDVTALTAALRRLIEDRALREEFGRNSRQRFVSQFSVDTMVRNTLEAYTEIVARAAA